jgi:hypothetical protein
MIFPRYNRRCYLCLKIAKCLPVSTRSPVDLYAYEPHSLVRMTFCGADIVTVPV